MREFIIKNGVLKKYRGGSTDVMIPDGVTEIGPGAFGGCGNLKGITKKDRRQVSGWKI